MPEKLSLADQAGLIAKNEVKLRTEYDGTQGKVSVTADHKFKYNITLRAYFEAILTGTKPRPTAGVEISWKP